MSDQPTEPLQAEPEPPPGRRTRFRAVRRANTSPAAMLVAGVALGAVLAVGGMAAAGVVDGGYSLLGERHDGGLDAQASGQGADSRDGNEDSDSQDSDDDSDRDGDEQDSDEQDSDDEESDDSGRATGSDEAPGRDGDRGHNRDR